MYYLVFSLLVFFSFIEVLTKKRNIFWFKVVYIMMTFMVVFRYGQLADYFNYEDIYYVPESAGIADPLYFIFTESIREIGFDYEGYVFILGAITMGLAYPFFSKLCKGSLTALFIFYCYIFLILPMSSVRQGLCISVLLCCFNLLLQKKKKIFYVVAIIGAFFHFSMLAVISIGFLFDKRWYNNWYVPWVLLGLTIFALITPDLSSYIPVFLEGKSVGEYEDSRLIQIALRAFLVFPLIIIKPKYDTVGYYAKAICIIGYCMYCTLAFSSMISGRLEFYFRVFLCLFASTLVFTESKIKNVKMVLEVVILVHIVLFFKNINSFIGQGDYDTNKVTMFNFPYISIFDKEELNQYK